MALYTYIAFNKSGKEVKDIIEANNLQGARNKLKVKGLYVKSIKEDEEKKERELFPFLAKILYRVPRKQVELFIRQLGTLVGAGIPLDKSLNNISEQVENKNLKKIIIDLRASITEGQSLSQAMTKYPDVFPEQFSSLISVGEKTGEYENTLIRLADLEEASSDMKASVQVAMIYPLIMGIVSLFVAVFLLVVVVPQIQELFNQFDTELPLITRIVIGISDAITGYWWLMLIVIFGGSAALSKWKSSVEGKKVWDKYFLKLPIFGTLTRKVLVSSFARNLGVLLNSRVSLITALVIVSKVVNNYVFQTEINLAIAKIKEGEKLSSSLQNSTILSPMVLGMISAGEISDTVPGMMTKLSEIYDKEVNNAIKSMTQSLEPIMIIVMGAVIFTIMAAIMTPMYKLTQEIQNL
jgi:general secretion pathway protein F